MSQDGNGTSKGHGDEVGYRKPPKKHQFKKGQSGNPRGRKKGARGLKTELNRVLNQSNSIKISGKVITGTPLALALHTLALRASSGNMVAIKQLIDTTLLVFGTGDRGEGKAGLSKQDQELLDRWLAQNEDSGELGQQEKELASGNEEGEIW